MVRESERRCRVLLAHLAVASPWAKPSAAPTRATPTSAWSAELVRLEQSTKLALTKQHTPSKAGRLSVGQRIGMLVDPDSLREVGSIGGISELDTEGNCVQFTPANFVLGLAKIDGRTVAVGGENAAISGGSPNLAGLRKGRFLDQLALQHRCPLVRLLEGAGGSVTGAKGKAAAGSRPSGEPVYQPHQLLAAAQLLQQVPVVALALGSVAGLPAAKFVASHCSVMIKSAQVLVAGPRLVKRALNLDFTKEELGGVSVHGASGVADCIAQDEQTAFAMARKFLSYLPRNKSQLPPVLSVSAPATPIAHLRSVIPRDRRRAYDILQIVGRIFDKDSFFELGAMHGRGIRTGLARLQGHPVAVFANDCRFNAGSMNAAAARKISRLIQLSNTFRLPMVSLVDEPGFMIGMEAEKEGTIRHGVEAAMQAALSTVPWATMVIRKMFGVAAAVHVAPGGTLYLWPSAELGALPVEGGVEIAFGKQIAQADDPDAMRAALEAKLAERNSPFLLAENFGAHEMIDPANSRIVLCEWIEFAWEQLNATQ